MKNDHHSRERFSRIGGLAIVLACGLWCGTPALAQDDAASDPSASETMETAFGLKGGVNYTTLYVEEAEDKNARLGFHLGAYARFASSQSLGFQLEALYSQKGMMLEKNYGDVDHDITYKFDYIEAPILLVIPMGEVFELHAGGYLGYMAVSEVSTSGDLGSATIDPKDSRFNGFDYGLVGGAGINLGMAQVGVRYEHGLNDIASDDVARSFLGSSKNAAAQAYLALALGKH